MTNAYIHDEHLARPEIRQKFWFNNELYSYNINKTTNFEYYSKLTSQGWIRVPYSIDLELAYETRKSRRYM